MYTRDMIPAKNRFHGHGSLRYVFTNGEAVRSQAVTVKWVKNKKRRNPRLSVVVSKKIFKRAIGRNKVRRRIYEYLRTKTINELDDVYDIVVIITSPDLRYIEFKELADQMDKLFSKAGIIK